MRHTADSIFDQTLVVGSVICRQCRLLWTAFWVFATLKTCQPCLNFHLHSANTETQVYTKISVFAHVLALALSQKQAVILSSACVCAVDWQHWIVVTVDGLQPFYPPPQVGKPLKAPLYFHVSGYKYFLRAVWLLLIYATIESLNLVLLILTHLVAPKQLLPQRQNKPSVSVFWQSDVKTKTKWADLTFNWMTKRQKATKKGIWIEHLL